MGLESIDDRISFASRMDKKHRSRNVCVVEKERVQFLPSTGGNKASRKSRYAGNRGRPGVRVWFAGFYLPWHCFCIFIPIARQLFAIVWMERSSEIAYKLKVFFYGLKYRESNGNFRNMSDMSCGVLLVWTLLILYLLGGEIM